MVLKATGRGTKHGRSAVVIALDGTRKKSFRVVGNIPELYHGMFIQMELDEADNVLDYELTLDERNITALERANVNPDEYEAVLERHLILKSDGIGWNTAWKKFILYYRLAKQIEFTRKLWTMRKSRPE